MPISLPAELLQEVQYSVNDEVYNRRKPIAVDRKAMPGLSFFKKRMKSSGQAGGQVIVKLKKNGGLDMQFWERRDRLGFGESHIDLELAFPFVNAHMGLVMPHHDLFDVGYAVTPNGPRGKNFAKPLSEDEANRLVNIVEEKIEDLYDTFDVKMDEIFWRDGSYDSKSLVGVDGLIPIDNTSGTIGGKSRTNPLLQHNVVTGMTYGAGNTCRAGLTQLRRDCEINGRGYSAGIDVIMAGYGWIDRYIAAATADGWTVNTQASGTKKLDIGLPESAIVFENTAIIPVPTFDILDVREPGLTYPWTRRGYFMSSKTWQVLNPTGLDKSFSAPMDEADLRESRMSLDSRLAMILTVPNANGVSVFAA